MDNAVDALTSYSRKAKKKSIHDLSTIRDWKNANELMEACERRKRKLIIIYLKDKLGDDLVSLGGCLLVILIPFLLFVLIMIMLF